MRVQISENTQRLLDSNEWDIRERGTIRLKGKGMVKTYWLNYRKTKTTPSSHRSSQRRTMSTTVVQLDARDLVTERINGGSNRVRPMTIDELGEDDVENGATTSHTGKRFSDESSTSQGRSNSDSLHDSNYSLFVRNRFKRSCAIL